MEAVEDDLATEDYARGFIDNLWSEVLGETFHMDPEANEAIHDSEKFMLDSDALINEVVPVSIPEPEAEDDPVPQDLIDTILAPILSYPAHLTTSYFVETLAVMQQSEIEHRNAQKVAKQRLAQDTLVVDDLVNELKAPNSQLRATLDEKRAQLEARREALKTKRSTLPQDAHSAFESRKHDSLAFRSQLDSLRESNSAKREHIRALRQRLIDINKQVIRDQEEQDVYFEEGRKLLSEYSDNRLASCARLRDQVMSAMLADAERLKQSLQKVVTYNAKVLSEGRRQLTLKNAQIQEIIHDQTIQLTSLNYTLSVLKHENALVSKLKVAQTVQQKEGVSRLQKLKEGFMLRKYHTTLPGKSSLRWLQLSDDATFLYYATGPHLDKKFKRYRVSSIQAVFVGPASSTFRKLVLHKDDNPTRLFSLLLPENETLDFGVPRSMEILTKSEFRDLPKAERSKYALSPDGLTYQRDNSLEVLETVVLGLHELTTLYQTNTMPVFTAEKYRWMRFLIGCMFPVDEAVPKHEIDLRRKHLRRVFGYKYYESQFELLQASGLFFFFSSFGGCLINNQTKSTRLFVSVRPRLRSQSLHSSTKWTKNWPRISSGQSVRRWTRRNNAKQMKLSLSSKRVDRHKIRQTPIAQHEPSRLRRTLRKMGLLPTRFAAPFRKTT
eukprot:c19962_g1_i3.p1 GENE.c19962_g1_i3~~c19962_g1_i3.p1  ORF type:complete len:667 (-),score=135.11 c19962_g1_i3:24-2024(-)